MIRIGSLISCLALSSTVFASATTTESTPNEDGATEKLPVVYTVPLVGQMGTDIHEDLIAEIIEDIEEVIQELKQSPPELEGQSELFPSE